MEWTYRNFTKKSIDLAPLGFEKGAEDETYFCTPKGAKIIGWAGVDGIHYCLIDGFGEMVFAVSPMNVAPNYVHPLAWTFSDFLRLLLACGSCDALEQAWQWDEAQFQGFLAENPLTQEQAAVLEQLAQQTGLAPMEHPWQYLHELQSGFAYDKIKYTEDYYDLDMNPDAPLPPPKWEVSFNGGFWSSRQGRPGKELPIRKEFDWAGYHWVIPSIYLCSKGIVMDFCMRVEPAAIRDFLKKWDLTPKNETERQFTQEQQMQLDLDNPLHMDFHSLLHLNGKELHSIHGYGTSYNPCVGPEHVVEDEAKRAVEHYGLDLNYAWVILRSSYPWATKQKPEIRQLSVTMIPDKVSIPGPHFQIRRPSETVAFCYGGQEYTLTVQEYEAQVMDWSRMPETGLEHPSHYVAMSYTITPELPDGVMDIVDCDDGDRPRQAPTAPDQPAAASCAMVVGIIGGADGPTAILYHHQKQGKLHAACSSLHFEPVEQVEWRIVFHEQKNECTDIDLIP